MTPEVKIQKPSLETITTVEENDPPYNMLMEEDEDNWMGNAASPAFINRGRNRFSNSHLSPVSAVEAPKKETVEERVIQPTTTAPDVAEVPPAPPTPAVSLTPAPYKVRRWPQAHPHSAHVCAQRPLLGYSVRRHHHHWRDGRE
ncbi:hypothetical protein AGDE_16437 [Angomonas deanei]|uniref:Uncharacterized protein n=1 Tax=Angomonas deanei TaxID=59799 RepID=A0A7G2CS28_9TRYP|nr:hypothetical protein AGDE_16437 [Angomonas deanei]CAD2222628.1 hypothetical protein, conserved [Angomonas deanei]|eukprot:EPY17081.1 hypothetical protein AGDE_16437 [Angomonas deanei]